MTVKTEDRLEERLIAKMREAGLLVTEAIEEQIYVEVFNGTVTNHSDFKEVFERCKGLVGREVEAYTKPQPGEIEL